MLKITVELIPFGQEELTKVIGEMVIANVSRLYSETCTYSFSIKDERIPEDINGVFKLPDRKLRDRPSWNLISDILNQVFNKGG